MYTYGGWELVLSVLLSGFLSYYLRQEFFPPLNPEPSVGGMETGGCLQLLAGAALPVGNLQTQ